MTKQESGRVSECEPRGRLASSPRHFVTPSLLILCFQSASALTIESSEARYVDKRYQFEMVAMLDAPVEKVQDVLRDYASYPQLDARILDAVVVDRPTEYTAILATTVRACFGPFCRNVKRVERVEEAPLQLTAVADPERSDVKSCETHMMLSVSDGRTRVSYRTSIVPSFWVPALAGRRWLLHTLSEATIDLFRKVELRAQGLPLQALPEESPQ